MAEEEIFYSDYEKFRKRPFPLRVTTLDRDRCEHYAVHNGLRVAEAGRVVFQAGLTALGVPEEPWKKYTAGTKRRSETEDEYMARKKAEFDARLAAGEEEERQKQQREEQEVQEQYEASMRELFGEKMVPTHCPRCGKGDPFFRWYTAQSPPCGDCQGCGYNINLEDFTPVNAEE